MKYLEISSGPDWDFRLHRNGRFVLRWDISNQENPDGSTSLSYRSASGKDLQEVFGGLFWLQSSQVAQFHGVLLLGQDYLGQANALQKEYSAKMRKIRAASVAQGRETDLDAALAEIRDIQQGGAQ